MLLKQNTFQAFGLVSGVARQVNLTHQQWVHQADTQLQSFRQRQQALYKT